MRADDLLTWNRATPFVPYRIRLNSGRTFDIRHPEMAVIGRTTINIFTFSNGPAEPFDRMEMVSLVLIESIEAINSSTAA